MCATQIPRSCECMSKGSRGFQARRNSSVIRQGDPLKEGPGVSAQRLVGAVEGLQRRVRRLEEHLGMERQETGPPQE